MANNFSFKSKNLDRASPDQIFTNITLNCYYKLNFKILILKENFLGKFGFFITAVLFSDCVTFSKALLNYDFLLFYVQIQTFECLCSSV